MLRCLKKKEWHKLGKFLSRLVLPRKIEHWSLYSLLVKFIKIRVKVVRHNRYIPFQMAEVAIDKRMKNILYLLILLILGGCLFDSNESENTNKKDDTTEPVYSLHGRVVDKKGVGVEKVNVKISGSRIDTTLTTDSNGYYDIINLISGEYTITPTKELYTFKPERYTIEIEESNVELADIVVDTIIGSIKGRIVDMSGKGVYNVELWMKRPTINQNAEYTAWTDLKGDYSFEGIPWDKYIITPRHIGFTFKPAEIKIILDSESMEIENITVTKMVFRVSGRVITTNGHPANHANVMLSNINNNETKTYNVDNNGYYEFWVEPGEYIVGPANVNCAFEPESISITVANSDTRVEDFIFKSLIFTFKGNVLDIDNHGIPNVTISMMGTSYRAYTDSNGEYILTGSVGIHQKTAISANSYGVAFLPKSIEVFIDCKEQYIDTFYCMDFKKEIKMIRIPDGVLERNGEKYSISCFYVNSTEITYAQYRFVVDSEEYKPTHIDNKPVGSLTWFDAVNFCNDLSKLFDLETRYEIKGNLPNYKEFSTGFRLPKETEWEFACRAGTKTQYYNGDKVSDLDNAGWYEANSGGESHEIAQKEPNAWGLYDMLGNMAEYTHYEYNEKLTRYYYYLCGGWYKSEAADCSVTSKYYKHDQMDQRMANGGIRVVCEHNPCFKF